jgi:hypothetical protein
LRCWSIARYNMGRSSKKEYVGEPYAGLRRSVSSRRTALS